MDLTVSIRADIRTLPFTAPMAAAIISAIASVKTYIEMNVPKAFK